VPEPGYADLSPISGNEIGKKGEDRIRVHGQESSSPGPLAQRSGTNPHAYVIDGVTDLVGHAQSLADEESAQKKQKSVEEAMHHATCEPGEPSRWGTEGSRLLLASYKMSWM